MESPWNLSRSEEGKKWLGLFSPLLLLLLHEMTRCEIYDSKRWRRKRRRRRRREVRQLLRLPSSFLREAALSGKYPPHKGDGEKSPPPPLHSIHPISSLSWPPAIRERERESPSSFCVWKLSTPAPETVFPQKPQLKVIQQKSRKGKLDFLCSLSFHCVSYHTPKRIEHYSVWCPVCCMQHTAQHKVGKRNKRTFSSPLFPRFSFSPVQWIQARKQKGRESPSFPPLLPSQQWPFLLFFRMLYTATLGQRRGAHQERERDLFRFVVVVCRWLFSLSQAF